MTKKLKQTYHKIGELLVRKGHVNPEEIDHALELQRAEIEQGKTPPRLGQILARRKILTKKTIDEILEEQKFRRGEKRTLKVDLDEIDGVAILRLEGRLEQGRESTITRVLERLMNHGVVRVAVDASKLVFLNSYGASAFVAYVDESRARGGDLKFFGLSTSCKFTLDRLGLSKFLQNFESKFDALRAFEIPIDEYLSRGALGEYISSESSKLYHLSYCQAAQKLSEEARIYFENKVDARNCGKTPCKKCRP